MQLRNYRHELAVREHLFNGASRLQAMRLAGYAKASEPNARRLFNRPDVRARLEELAKAALPLTTVEFLRCCRRREVLAYSSMTDYFKTGPDGVEVYKDICELTPDQAAAIKRVKMRDGQVVEITLHDPHASLVAIEQRNPYLGAEPPPAKPAHKPDGEEQRVPLHDAADPWPELTRH